MNIRSESVLVIPVDIDKKIYELISLDQSIPVTRIQLNENFKFDYIMRVLFTKYGYILGYHQYKENNIIKFVKITDKPVVRKIVLPEEVEYLQMKDQPFVFIVTEQKKLLLLNLETEAVRFLRSFSDFAVTDIEFKNDIVYLSVLYDEPKTKNIEAKILIYNIKTDKVSEMAANSFKIAINNDSTILAYREYMDENLMIRNLKTGKVVKTNLQPAPFAKLQFLNSNTLMYLEEIDPYPWGWIFDLPSKYINVQYMIYDIESGRELKLNQIKISRGDRNDGLGPFIIEKADALMLIKTMGLKKEK